MITREEVQHYCWTDVIQCIDCRVTDVICSRVIKYADRCKIKNTKCFDCKVTDVIQCIDCRVTVGSENLILDDWILKGSENFKFPLCPNCQK